MRDAELIHNFCGGQTEAFNPLVERWQHRIHRLAFRYFNSHDEASDITQKTFIKVYKKLHTLDEPTAFPAWIYRIANNLCRDEARRAGRKNAAPMEAFPYHPAANIMENPDRPLQKKEWNKLLQQALQQLPTEQRMVVIMKEYEELKFTEIAQALDTPQGTVKSRLYAGLTKLHQTFDQWNINKEQLYYE